MLVVKVMDRAAKPEYKLGTFMLELMRVGCERGVARCTQGEASGSGPGIKTEVACRGAGRGDGQAAQEVIAEFAPDSLAPSVAMVLGMEFSQKLAPVHHAMHPVLDDRSGHKGRQKRHRRRQPEVRHARIPARSPPLASLAKGPNLEVHSSLETASGLRARPSTGPAPGRTDD